MNPHSLPRLAGLLLACTAAVSALASIIPADRLPTPDALPWKPGIPGGIPTYPVATTINAATYGNGSTDATSAIQTAIDNCPTGRAVYLPAGTYNISQTLVLKHAVVLRGAGPTSTKIVQTTPGNGNSIPVIAIGLGGGEFLDSSAVAVTAGLAKGSTSITVANASTFDVGSTYLLDQLDDASLPIGNASWFKRGQAGSLRSIGQMVEVVGKSGNTLTLGSPLYWNFSAALSPQLVKPANYDGATNKFFGTITRAGVEDLGVYDGSGANIVLALAAYCWVRNVESVNCAGRSIMIVGSYRCEIRDSYIHDAPAYNTGGGAYGISLAIQTADTLVENNIVMHFNQVLLFENSGGGNVVAYNYLDNAFNNESPGWLQPSLTAHCSLPRMELVEGNLGALFGPDNVHGGAFDLTFLRNHATGTPRDIPVDMHTAFHVESGNYYFNLLGNVLLTPASAGAVYEGKCSPFPMAFDLGGRYTINDACLDPRDPQVAQTMIRHGNFDYAHNGVVWDATIADHAIPASLYLAAKPAFFGSAPWPWVDGASAANPLPGTLPAKLRYDAIRQPPLVIRHPQQIWRSAAPLGEDFEYFVVAVGDGRFTYQWQVSTDGRTWNNITASANYVTPTSPRLGIVQATSGIIASSFRCVVTNAVGPTRSSSAGVSYPCDWGFSPQPSAPKILVQPKSVTVAIGTNASFNLPTDGNPYPSFRWQRSTNGGSTWTDLAESATYVGTTTDFLTVTSTTAAMSNDRFRCVAKNASATVTSAGAVLTVTAAPPNTYAAWRGTSFSATDAANDAISGPLADPDSSGLNNLARYAFGLAPRGPVAVAIAAGTTTSGGSTYATLTFNRRAVASDLSYSLEASADLVTWTALPGQTYPPGSPTSVTAQDSVAMGAGGGARRFLRLRITSP